MTNDELPEGWIEAPLADVVDVLDSKRVPLNADEREQRIRNKTQSDLVPYYGATGQVGFIDQALFDEPLILLGEDGVPFFDPIRNKAYRISGKSWVNNHAHVLRSRVSVADDRYIAGFLNSFDYTGYVTGSTRLKLTQGSMNSIPVLLAPLAEQKRIADKLEAVLGRVAACRARLDRVPDLLKRFRQSVLAAATSGQLTEEWREENAANDEWENVQVRDIAEEIFDGPFGSHLKTDDYTEAGVRVVRLENIGSLRFFADKQTFISPAKYKTLTRHTLKEHDVIFSSFISEEIRVSLLPKSWSGKAINKSDCFCVRADHEKCLPKFLAFRLACRSTFVVLGADIHGATRPRINLGQLKEYLFELPSVPEQHEIVRRVETLFAFADRIEARLTAARAQVERLTPATLAKAFRGELVPQDPNDEPASALLERLRTQPAAPGLPRNGRKAHAPLATEAPEAALRRATVAPAAQRSREPQLASVAVATRPTSLAVAPAPASPTPVADLDKNDWMSLLREVLTAHGPCDRETVIQQAAYALDYQRAGRVVAAEIDNAIRAAVRRRVVLHEGHELRVNRAGVAEMEADDREFMKDQFLASISQGGRVWIEREEAPRLYALWFGFRRTGSQIQDRVKSLINGLIRDRRLESEGFCIRRV